VALLTLLSRAYCHLCDEMRVALAPIAQRHGAEVVEIDVDADPALEARFGERVPVLLLGAAPDGTELCHHQLAAPDVDAALARAARIG
jgi:thiol-disulfide isomerase/thioredoxin